MKNILIISLLIIGFLQGSCKKEDEVIQAPVPTPLIQLGKVSYKNNGQTITKEYVCNRPDGYPNGFCFILINNKRSGSGLAETFDLSNIPLKQGKYEIFDSSPSSIFGNKPYVSSAWAVDEDQSTAFLSSSTKYPSDFVEVVRYDSIQNIIEGRFEVHLESLYNTDPNWNIPDSMHITEGVFHIKIN
jgi:hypothetical protein